MSEPPQPLKKPPGYRDPAAVNRKAALHYNKKERRWSTRRLCCCFTAVFLSTLTVVAAISAAIFYLWFTPRLPEFHLQSLRIRHLNVTTGPDEASVLGVAAVARVEAKNPNSKLEVYYGSGRVEVFAGEDGAWLGGDDVAGFGLGEGETVSLKVETAVNGLAVEEGVGRRLTTGFRRKELVVELRVRTRVGYVVEGIRVGTVDVRVLCGGVRLKRLGPGGDMPKCTLQFFTWIKIH